MLRSRCLQPTRSILLNSAETIIASSFMATGDQVETDGRPGPHCGDKGSRDKGSGDTSSGKAALSLIGSAFRALLPLWLLVETLTAAGSPRHPPILEDLGDLTWRYRVLLIRAPAGDSTVGALQHHQKAAAERDLLWFVVHDGQLATNYAGLVGPDLGNRLQARLITSGVRVLLIGKDGRTKLSAGDLDLPGVFARIDGMPMRQREMRAREKIGRETNGKE